jgi:PHD/YefM family antitoxin component YafN of YafNO toxin-antitoxin module
MIAVHPEFVVDRRARKKAVLVPLSEWQRLMEAIEELEDIRAYDRAKARREAAIPFEEAVRQIRAKARK